MLDCSCSDNFVPIAEGCGELPGHGAPILPATRRRGVFGERMGWVVKYSAGEWELQGDYSIISRQESDVIKIADIYAAVSLSTGRYSFAEGWANGVLICAAPDLLAACEAAVNWVGLDGDGIDEPVLGQLQAAIYKAKGAGCLMKGENRWMRMN